MIYVALLRGINVGGNNKIDMKVLKEAFLQVGMTSVCTYINSGNVIFEDSKHSKDELAKILEKAILDGFKLDIKVLIRNFKDIEDLIKALPDTWKNDATMKCDVLFLWDEMVTEECLKEIEIKPAIDTVITVSGAILWKVDKVNVAKSSLMKLAGKPIYKKMTVRNVNSARKIYEIMKTINTSL
ncbi:MAG: hypothetical protein CVU95_14240 [Firmicutes bacterium HGW-Firmicutes-2]|jgi:uncharacterized protein (DUF1697 family)|nr:MAG: hypothetical protein CVU95_14240 [Firmicutes bacterium HGW-Firmicutes-2]